MIKDGATGLLEAFPLNCGSSKSWGSHSCHASLSGSQRSISFMCLFIFYFPLPGPPTPAAHNVCQSPEEYSISSAPKRKRQQNNKQAAERRLTYNTAQRKELHSSNTPSLQHQRNRQAHCTGRSVHCIQYKHKALYTNCEEQTYFKKKLGVVLNGVLGSLSQRMLSETDSKSCFFTLDSYWCHNK